MSIFGQVAAALRPATTDGVKIFVSSLISGYETYRAAVVDAATLLGHQVLRAEDLPASPATPQQACCGLVRESDVVVLLMGERYGATQQSGLSATHEEYREARERKPVLVFLEETATPEAAQAALRHEVEAWEAGHIRRGYRDPASLREAVIRALHDHELAMSQGSFDESECAERAYATIPGDQVGFGSRPELNVPVAGGPHQQVIRPADLDDPGLTADLQREALFSEHVVFDPAEGMTTSAHANSLILKQRSAEVTLDQAGSIRIVAALRSGPSRSGTELPAIIQEDVQARLIRTLGYIAWTLDRIDPVRRLTDVVVLAHLAGAGWMPWRTRAEHDASPTAGQLGLGGDAVQTVALTPAVAIARRSLTTRSELLFRPVTRRKGIRPQVLQSSVSGVSHAYGGMHGNGWTRGQCPPLGMPVTGHVLHRVRAAGGHRSKATNL